jgi:hypothetical protein
MVLPFRGRTPSVPGDNRRAIDFARLSLLLRVAGTRISEDSYCAGRAFGAALSSYSVSQSKQRALLLH